MATVKLKDLGRRSGGYEARTIRGVKVVKPMCRVKDDKHPGEWTSGPCMRDGGTEWYINCLKLGHEPYSSDREETRYTAVTEEKEIDGEVVTVITDRVPHTILRRDLNLHQVPVSERINNGRNLEVAWAEGCVNVEQFGLAPFCEYWECWNQSTVKFYGDEDWGGMFCSVQHAKLVKADETGEVLTVLQWENSDPSRPAMKKNDRRKKELSNIAI